MKKTIESTNGRIDKLILKTAKYRVGETVVCYNRVGNLRAEAVVTGIYVHSDKPVYDIIYTSSPCVGYKVKHMHEYNLYPKPKRKDHGEGEESKMTLASTWERPPSIATALRVILISILAVFFAGVIGSMCQAI